MTFKGFLLVLHERYLHIFLWTCKHFDRSVTHWKLSPSVPAFIVLESRAPRHLTLPICQTGLSACQDVSAAVTRCQSKFRSQTRFCPTDCVSPTLPCVPSSHQPDGGWFRHPSRSASLLGSCWRFSFKWERFLAMLLLRWKMFKEPPPPPPPPSKGYFTPPSHQPFTPYLTLTVIWHDL